MITLARFEKKFFIDLYKIIMTYGQVWVLEDGNIYLAEKSALSKAREKTKIATLNGEEEQILRWIHVDINNLPTNMSEMSEMFDSQEADQRKAKRGIAMVEAEKKATPMLMDDAEVEAKIAELKIGSVESKMNKDVEVVIFNGKEIVLSKAKTILKSVLGSFGANTGVEKTQKAIDELSEEQKAKFEEELSKE